MQIIKRLSEVGASQIQLNQLEVLIGSPLPSDYRQFMTQFNGGRPSPSGIVFETPEGPSDCSVRYFLTLDETEHNYALSSFLDRYQDRIPDATFPIACDSFGNLVLLSTADANYGSIFFWDHEKEGITESPWDNTILVAQSFSAFIDHLQ